MTRFVWVAAVVALLSVPTVSRADEASVLAREHYREGTKLFDLGHYLEAAEEYERAYRAKEAPALLYNLAQAYRLGGEPEKALRAYRAFLRNVPDSPDRAKVLALIETLKHTVELQKQAQEKPPTNTLQPAPEHPAPAKVEVAKPSEPPPPVLVAPAAPPPDPHQLALGRKLRLAGIGVGALGIGALVAGGVLASSAADIANELNHPATKSGALPIYNHGRESTGRAEQAATIACFAVGGAALVGGVALIVVGTRKVQHNRYAVAPALGPSYAGASLAGSF